MRQAAERFFRDYQRIASNALELGTYTHPIIHLIKERDEAIAKWDRASANYTECAVVRDDWEGQAFKMQNERDALKRENDRLKDGLSEIASTGCSSNLDDYRECPRMAEGFLRGEESSYSRQLIQSHMNVRDQALAKLDICKRYAEGEGADGDCAELANDYGGTGYENDPAVKAVSELQQRYVAVFNDLKNEKEKSAVLESQVENADVNLEQVKMALKSQHQKEVAALLERIDKAFNDDHIETAGWPDNASVQECAEYILKCAEGWHNEMRLIGNIRVWDIKKTMRKLIDDHTLLNKLNECVKKDKVFILKIDGYRDERYFTFVNEHGTSGDQLTARAALKAGLEINAIEEVLNEQETQNKTS